MHDLPRVNQTHFSSGQNALPSPTDPLRPLRNPGAPGRGSATTAGGRPPAFAAEPGSGMSSVTIRPSLSKTAERGSTERTVQPESASPSRIRVKIFELSLRKTPIRILPPMTVPTSVKGGAGGGVGLTRTGTGRGGGGTAAIGGRRDVENSGRSRVAESVDRGIAHKGLPAFAGSGPLAGTATMTVSASKFGATLSISTEANAPPRGSGLAEQSVRTTQGAAMANATQRRSFLMVRSPSRNILAVLRHRIDI